jgi:hypothetical protein
MYLDQAKKNFYAMLQEFYLPDETQPYSPEDLWMLEQKLKLPLPKAYKEYLLWLGKDSGRFWDYFGAGNPIEDRNDAIELLDFNKCAESLPNDAIVFFMNSQRYHFRFIRFSEGNNPPIHEYLDGNSNIDWNLFQNFEDLILRYIESLSKTYRQQ